MVIAVNKNQWSQLAHFISKALTNHHLPLA